MTQVGKTSSFDEMLAAVADTHRRTLLLALLEENPQDESPVGNDDSDDDAVEQLTQMRYVHLPKLVEYGFINWDKEASEVTKGPNFDALFCRRVTAVSDAVTAFFRQINRELDAVWRYGIAQTACSDVSRPC